MLDKDPDLFYLTLELCDSNPSQEGLTKKTLVLDMDSRLVVFSSCHTRFDCKFILRMKMGKEVKIFISVLDQNMEVITIRINEDTTMIIMMFVLILNMFVIILSRVKLTRIQETTMLLRAQARSFSYHCS